MAEELLFRKDVKKELTWDLSLIYKDEEALLADADRMEKLTAQAEEEYKGSLDSADRINACLDMYREIEGIITLIGNYCELATSVDYYDTHNMELAGKLYRRISECTSRLSFIDSELAVQPDSVIQMAAKASKKNAGYLNKMLRRKPYLLSPETEKVLAALSQTTGAPYEIYNTAKLADMRFPDFEVAGKKYPLGYSLFEDDYEYDERTDVRRAAFEAFSAKLHDYENVTAVAYNTAVQHEKKMADLRGFDNVFDKLLFNQRVDISLYNRQIDIIMEKLAPHMRKYAKLLGRVHKLDRVTYADLKLPVDATYSPKLTIEESRDYVTKGLSILGEDYVKMVETAYEQRWFDFAQNQGKSTGGFCASPYGKNSFILLSWNGRMSDVFTIAHELGHAGHFKACNAAQSIFDTDVSKYFVECPSTMNELLLGHYLLKTSDDKRFRRWVLANMVGNTYYHNFVTHLLEAAYQREVYRKVQNGGSVQAETLSTIMKDVLSKFWGDAVELTDGAELTWMRQPHYYMGLYSYTYSAGLTIATQVCKRIENEGQAAVDDWKNVLKAGGTKTPVELAAMAGIDITTDAPLLDTIETIGAMIDEICELTEELEK